MPEQKNQDQYLSDVSEMMGWDEPKQIITEVSGFYPIFEAVLQETKDHTTAAVHGIMWRFCQMSDGVCKASMETIAEILGIGRATVMRRQNELVERGYFTDLTPKLKNKPHVYADNKKVVMRSQLSASPRFTMKRECFTMKRDVSPRNVSVSQSHMNKVFNKDFNKDNNGRSGFADVTTFYENNIAPLTQYDGQLLGDLCDDHQPQWVLKALEICVANNKRNLAYAKGILKRWKENNNYGEVKKNGNSEPPPQPEIIRAPENPTPIISPEKLRAAREKAGI